jgi:hypothetical protein
MVILSKALRLQATLRQLRHDRDLYLENPRELDLLTAIPLPIMMSGIASRATALDGERIGTAPRAFGTLPDPASIPLRLEHKEDSNPGTITELSYDDVGNLLVTCRVTDQHAAMRPAFSISASVDEYVVNAATCSGIVTKCRLQEISLVRAPLDAGSLVQRRWPPPRHTEFYTNAISAVEKLQQLTRTLMKERNHGSVQNPA